jgi:hypothetical protein
MRSHEEETKMPRLDFRMPVMRCMTVSLHRVSSYAADVFERGSLSKR